MDGYGTPKHWQPDSYNRNVISLFHQDAPSDSSDNEDSNDGLHTRDFPDDDIMLDEYLDAAADEDLFMNSTADDWFNPGAEEPIPTVEEPDHGDAYYEDKDIPADLFEDDGVDDFFFGPPKGYPEESRGRNHHARATAPPVSTGFAHFTKAHDKVTGNNVFRKQDTKPAPMAFQWMNQAPPRMPTPASEREGINQHQQAKTAGIGQPAPTSLTPPQGRGFRKLQPVGALKPPGMTGFASARKKPAPIPVRAPVAAGPENNSSGPVRPIRPRSPRQTCSRTGDVSGYVADDEDDKATRDGKIPVPPCPTPTVPEKVFSVPTIQGKGPFWQGKTQDRDFANHRPVEMLSREEVLQELTKANKRIWELEIDGFRGAWERQLAGEYAKDVEAANETIRRLENTIISLQAARKCAMDHLDLAGEEIRGLKDRRVQDAQKLAIAHLTIKQLQADRMQELEESRKKRKWVPERKGPMQRARASAEDYVSRRKSWVGGDEGSV